MLFFFLFFLRSTQPASAMKLKMKIYQGHILRLWRLPELHPNSLAPFSDKPSEHSREIIPVGVSIQSREYNSSTADWLIAHLILDNPNSQQDFQRERLLTYCPCVSNQQPVNHMTKYTGSLFLRPDREIKNKDAPKKNWNLNHWFPETKLMEVFSHPLQLNLRLLSWWKVFCWLKIKHNTK